MKKLLIIFYLTTAFNMEAQGIFLLNFNSGNFYVGMNFSADNNIYDEFSFDIINIGLEHYKTKIGIEYSPVKYWELSYEVMNDIKIMDKRYSFLNFRMYWNIFNWEIFEELGNLFIGPVTSIHYLMLQTNNYKYKLKWDNFVFSIGFRIGLNLMILENLKYSVIGFETGYRNIDGRSNYYFSVNFDIVITSIIVIGSIFSE